MEKEVHMTHDKDTRNYHRYVAPQGLDITGMIFVKRGTFKEVPTTLDVKVNLPE